MNAIVFYAGAERYGRKKKSDGKTIALPVLHDNTEERGPINK